MATLNTYRAAIVGCGRIGTGTGDPAQGRSRIKSHAEAYADLPNVELVALADPDAAALGRASDAWVVEETFADVASMLTTVKPDLLSVCAPPAEHVHILRLAIEAGVKGVLLEKPVAPDLAAAAEAMALTTGASSRVAVNYTRRYPPAYRTAIESVRGGGIGRVQQAYGVYTKGIVNNGSHMIDLLRAMLGDPISAEALSGDGAGSDPTVSARLTFADGAQALMAAADGDAFNVFDLDILGTEGRISFTDLGHAVQRSGVDDTIAEHGFRQLSGLTSPEPTLLADAIRYAVEDLIESIETGRAPLCTIDDGYAALDIALGLGGVR
jgi:predicted dehydrogenase